MQFSKRDWIAVGVLLVIAVLAVIAFIYGSFSGGIVLAAVAVGGGLIYFAYLKKKPQAQSVTSLTNLGFNKSHFGGLGDEAPTPGGTPVQSVGAIPLDALKVCDAGISQQISEYDAVKGADNWPNYRNLSDYRLLFIRSNATSETGEPAFFINGTDPTSTTGFGRVKCAAFCIGMQAHTGAKRPTIAIPYELTLDPKYYETLKFVAQAESEHCRERENDMDVYNKYLGKEDQHPHPAREATGV